ncbi:MAG: SusC/RagA family TonB-linked outer membrane protein, partial [Bacteroidota bacterium]|nr:SusC/RagA family TonB-linked outer membrane protein [Bacteroidota bacterium]
MKHVIGILYLFLFANITIAENNIVGQVTLSDAIKQIETKFDVSITFEVKENFDISHEELKKVLSKKNITLALDKLLEKKNLNYKKLNDDFYVIFQKKKKTNKEPKKPQKQDEPEKVIKGKVVDKNGEALAFANVVAGNKRDVYTITDINGEFEIRLPENVKELLVSYVGFKTQIVKINNIKSNTLYITLEEDVFGLEEIIVSGVAANTPTKKLTVTIAKVKASEIEDVPPVSAAQSLQGKVSGVVVKSAFGLPGSGANIRLRGSTSLIGNQSPLIMVDGIMVQTSLADINVDDIESIEVVKGAAAASLYGSKAGNGVIVIQTKRGNELKDGFKVVVRNEFGRSQLPDQIQMATHHPYKLADDADEFTYTKYDNVDYDDEGNIIGGNQILTDSAYADQPYATLRNHQKDFFKKGNYYTNYVSLARKSGKTNLFMSFENHNNEGVVFATDGYSRQNFRFNADTRVGKYIKLSMSNLIMNSSSDKPGSSSSFFDLLFINPDVDLSAPNDDGSPYNILPDPWSIEENPLYPLYYRERLADRNSIMTNVNGTFSPIYWFNVQVKYTYEILNKNWNTYTPKGYLYDGESSIGGKIFKEQYTSKFQTFQTTANFNKMINNFTIKSKLSYMQEDQAYYDFWITGKDFVATGVPQLSNTDPTLASMNSYEGIIRAKNIFAITDIDYKSKYMISALYRYDGSSLFGEFARWNPYFRIAGAYRISEDINIPFFQELKIRSAYGTSGQRPGFSYQYETWDVASGMLSKEQLGNKNLKPSESKEAEIALDAQFLNNFTFTASYSKTQTDDAFALAPLASHLGGYTKQWRNVGSIISSSLEFSLGWMAINRNDKKLSFRLNYDKIQQEVGKLNIPEYRTGPKNAYLVSEGEIFGIVYGYKWLTSLEQMESQIPEGKSIDDYIINSDGYIIEAGTEGSTLEAPIAYDKDNDNAPDKVVIANGNPDFNLSLSTRFNFRAFTFYMLWDWRKGSEV